MSLIGTAKWARAKCVCECTHSACAEHPRRPRLCKLPMLPVLHPCYPMLPVWSYHVTACYLPGYRVTVCYQVVTANVGGDNNAVTGGGNRAPALPVTLARARRAAAGAGADAGYAMPPWQHISSQRSQDSCRCCAPTGRVGGSRIGAAAMALALLRHLARSQARGSHASRAGPVKMS